MRYFAFLAHKKLTRILLGNLYRGDFGGILFTTSTRIIEHKKVGIVHVAVCLRLNSKITGLWCCYYFCHSIALRANAAAAVATGAYVADHKTVLLQGHWDDPRTTWYSRFPRMPEWCPPLTSQSLWPTDTANCAADWRP